MSRKVARDTLFKMVFELCFHKAEESLTYEEFLSNNSLESDNLDFIKEMYIGIVNNLEELTEIVSKNIKGYTIDRLFKVDLAILLIATYELTFYKQTPANVVANEAVELAKKYSTEKSYSFINGVIASLIK